MNNNINLLSDQVKFFFIILFIIQFYYFFIDFFILGLFVHYGFNIGMGLVLLGFIIIHGLIFYTLFQIYEGVINKEIWVRKFSIFYLFWASLWAIWGLIVGNNYIVHIILLMVYILMILYLTTPVVQLYFKKIFRYGKYILYTRKVMLRSGRELPIFFFSWKTPKSGHPTTLPDGYKVEENKNSHMPYLVKKHHETKKQSRYKKKERTDIIYVVNNGNDTDHSEPWIVKSPSKIYDYVQTKQKAIKKARAIAVRLNARVLVQNTNGKFSYGFTPRSQK